MSEPRTLDVVDSHRFDYSFAEEIIRRPGGEHLFTCSSCGTCTATCLVRRVDAAFNPRLLILKATLGFREEILAGPEIWECSACDACFPRCPKGIHISELFKAIRDVAISAGHERHGFVATVNAATCTGCGMCATACPYSAIRIEPTHVNRQVRAIAQVDKNLCFECGICNSVCPSSSISVKGYTDGELHTHLVRKAQRARALPHASGHGKIVALVCQWCLHSNLDVQQALHPPQGVEVVQVPCTGRVSPLMVLTSLRRGAEAVLTVGCQRGECHYRQGSEIEARRSDTLGRFLELLGVDKRRLRFVRMGSLDRGRFGRLVDDCVQDVQRIGPFQGVA